MAETKNIVLFEENWVDNFYIKLESTHDTAASGLQISSIGVTETLSSGSPFLVMYIQDAFGDLINHTYISPDAVYDLYIGKDKDDNTKSSFSMSVNNMENVHVGKTETIALDLTFMSDKWNKFIREAHSRSWKDTSYSDVVKDIITENEFSDVDVETTQGRYDVIQPNWSNMKFVKWLSQQAVNTEGNTGYDFGVTLDNRMIFKSLDTLYKSKPKRSVILAAPNNEFEFSFHNFSIKQNYAPMIIQGAGGLTYTYFDYDTKTYITDTKTVEDSGTRQLSDWAFIAESHNTATKIHDGGRDIDTPTVAESKITSVANSIQKVSINMVGDFDLHIGDVINILIPSSEFSTTLLNEKYSGYWLIGEILQDVDFVNKTFQSNITLIRAGINGTELKGLVKTTKGKQLGK